MVEWGSPRNAWSHIARRGSSTLLIVCISVLRGEYGFSGGYEAGGVVHFSGACGVRFLEKVLLI